MTIVTADREVVAASLVRSAPEAPSYAGLHRVGQKLARGLGEYLGGVMAAPAAVSVSEVRLDQSPASDAVVTRHVRLAPLDGSLVLAMERAALMRLVDLYYGGDGAEDARRDQLSPSEGRFYSRIAGGLCTLLRAAWQPLAAVEPMLDEGAAEETAAAIVQTFTITYAGHSPFEIECRYPASLGDMVPGLHSAAPAAPDAIGDQDWQARLMDRALSVQFPVHAVFAEPELPVSMLMKLRPGDIIPICLPPQIDLTVAGLRFARGSAGESNGRAAICIDHR